MSAARPPGTRFAALVLLVWIAVAGFAGPRAACAQAPDTLESSSTRFVLFTNNFTFPDASSAYLGPWIHFAGRVHTNTQLRFTGDPTFTDTVSSVSSTAGYFNNGNPVTLASDHNGTIDVPRFERGLVLGAAAIPLPMSTVNHQAVAAGAPGTDPVDVPTNQQLNTWLGLGGGSSAPLNGVYVPHTGSGSSVSGGIYIQGNADQVKMWTDTTSNIQYYRITQGTNVWDITVNRATNSTTYDPPSSGAVTYPGVPRGCLFTTGSVADLRGPDRVSGLPQPAAAEGTRLLVCAHNDIVIQGDLTLDRYDEGTNVLGIISETGTVRVGTTAPDDCHLDAFVLATGSRGAFAVDAYDVGAPRGTFHLRGGCVTQYFGSFCTFDDLGVLQTGYARDFRHDDRNIAPPYFPGIVRVVSAPPPAPTAPTRLSLSRPSPNPSRGTWHVRYSLPRAQHVRLALYDVMGRRVAPLVDAAQTAGEHEAWWRNDGARRLRPGMYLLLLESGGERARTKLVLIP